MLDAVVDQKSAIAAIRAAALDNTANSVMIANSQGVIIWANPAFTKLTGYALEEITGQTPSLLKSGKHDKAFYEDLWNTITNGKIWQGNLTNRRKDGSLYYGEQMITPVRSECGKITHFIGIMNDITARHLAEEELRLTHEKLCHVLAHNPAIFYALKIQNDTVSPYLVSERITEFLGFSKEESCDYDWWYHHVHPDDRAAAAEHPRQTLQHGAHACEYRIQHKDGSYRWVEDNERLICDSAGQTKEIAGVLLDITKRKSAEQDLRESEEKFRQLTANLNDVFWLTTSDLSQVLYVSPAYEKVWGRPVKNLYDRAADWSDAIVEEDRPKVLELFGNVIKGVAVNMEYRIRTPSGSIRWISDRGIPVKNEKGEVYRQAGMATDITEKKLLEVQFLRAQRMESIGTLAGGIAHDLNNALAPILMATSILSAKFPDPESLGLLQLLTTSAQRGADMVKQLLTISRGIEGQRTLVQLKLLVREMQTVVRQTFP